MSKKYKVSILVPVYGVEKYIERCATSLFEQDFDSLEFLFLDDCTVDRSIDILERTISRYPKLKDDIKIIKHSQNKGLGSSRNTLLDNATGEYVCWVDGDDFLDHNAISLLYSKSKGGTIDVVVGGLKLHIGKTIVPYHRRQPISTTKEGYIKQLLNWGTIEMGVCAKLIRRSLYNNYSIFIESGVNMGEDFSAICRLVYYANGVGILNKPIYNYEKDNETSISSGIISSTKLDSLIRASDINYEFFKDKPLYKNDLLIGRNRIRLFILRNASADNNISKYVSIFPDLKGFKSQFYDRLLLWCYRNNLKQLSKYALRFRDTIGKLTSAWKRRGGVLGFIYDRLTMLKKTNRFKCDKIKFKRIGLSSVITPPYTISGWDNISIGDNCYVGPNATIYSTRALLTLYSHVVIGPNLTIITGDHMSIPGRWGIDVKNDDKKIEYDQDVVIEDDVWIGANVTILKGVTIGRSAIVAAGAIVIKDVEPYSIVAGNPARFIKYKFTENEIATHDKALFNI